MKKIRSKVFETNSSSSHSISIVEGDEDFYETIYPDENGMITLGGIEFGWGWERYTDALTKAIYCAEDGWGDEYKRTMLVELLQEHTGAIAIEFLEGGYIDHESIDSTSDAFQCKQALKDFIFNPKSILFIGNDNSEAPPNFYDPVDAVYDKKLVIEGLDDFSLIYQGMSETFLISNISKMMRNHPLTHHVYQNGSDNYSYFDYNVVALNGKQYTSLSKISQGIIVLFKTEIVRDKKGYWTGINVLDSKEIKYDIMPYDDSD